MSGELFSALLAGPQSLWTHQGHALHSNLKGVVYELSDGFERGIGHKVLGQRLFVIEEVLPILDVAGNDHIASLTHHLHDTHITGARLPDSGVAPVQIIQQRRDDRHRRWIEVVLIPRHGYREVPC